MPLGVEYGARFELQGPDGTVAVFNDSSDPNFVGILSPESSGLDSADVREDAQDRSEADGGVHGSFWFGRRPVILQGTIIASSKSDRAAKIAKIRRASNAMRSDCALYWKDAGLGGSKVTYLYLRRQQPVRITGGWTKNFMIPLVAAYPYIKGEGAVKSTTIKSPQKTVKKFPGTQTVVTMGAGFGEHNEGSWEPGTSGGTSEDGIYTKNEPLADPVKMLYLVFTNFKFELPGTATILGVKVGIKRKASAGASSIKDWYVGLIQNTSLVGSNKAATGTNWPTAVATATYGSLSDTWSAGLSAAGLNKNGANEAGFAFIAQRGSGWAAGNKAEIDAGWMEVAYEEATPPVQTVSITNNGDATAPAIIDLYGKTSGVENVTIENQTTGDVITLTGKINPGQHVRIDTYNCTVKDYTTGENLYHLIDFANTTWWGVEPGANTIGVTGDWSDGTAEMSVTINDHYV